MANLPEKFKAVVYDKPGEISTKVEELDMPEPGPREVLVNLTHSGVCHSDLGVMTNRWKILPHPTQAGQVGGHEGVGTIVKMGPGTETSQRQIGDRVGIKWIAAVCGSCSPCLSGDDGHCFKSKVSGYYTMLCAGVTAYSALRKSGAEPGSWVVLLGAGGGLGHLATQMGSRGMGFRIIGVDHPSKKEFTLQCGAEVFIDHTSQNVEEEVKKVTGGLGAQSVLVVTAANAAYASALGLLRSGGSVVCVGIPEGDLLPIASASPGMIVAKSATIQGVAVGNRKDAIATLDFAARGIVKTRLEVKKMVDVTEVFERMDRGELQGRVVVDLG